MSVFVAVGVLAIFAISIIQDVSGVLQVPHAIASSFSHVSARGRCSGNLKVFWDSCYPGPEHMCKAGLAPCLLSIQVGRECLAYF